MATDKTVMAVIRAARPSFRNIDDKIAFAVHSTFLASGHVLIATGRPAFSDNALSSNSTDEVGIEEWNEQEDKYAFVYINPEKDSKKVLVKCLVINDKFLVSALPEGAPEPLRLEINPDDHAGGNGGTNYSTQYKNLEGLVMTLDTQLLSKLYASQSPLVAILTQNKLTGPNYVDWRMNLDSVLNVEEHKFVLSEPCPDYPTIDAPYEEWQRFDSWRESNEIAKNYILTSISDVLQHQLKDMELASDIMFNLKEMYSEQCRFGRQDTMRLLLNTKMAQGTPVRQHCLKMISYLNTLEVLGADIDGESQVDMILESLPKSFKECRLNMNKKIYTLSELMNELVKAEGVLVKAGVDINMAEASSSQNFAKQEGKQVVLGVADKGKKIAKDYTKGKCFHCGEKGHWKKNCPKFLAAKNKGVLED